VLCACVGACLANLVEEFMELGGGWLCINDADGFVRLLCLCVVFVGVNLRG
jgi:hypothetical protein